MTPSHFVLLLIPAAIAGMLFGLYFANRVTVAELRKRGATDNVKPHAKEVEPC